MHVAKQPRAKQVVITAGSPSGMAATASATAILKPVNPSAESFPASNGLQHPSTYCIPKHLEIVDAAPKHLKRHLNRTNYLHNTMTRTRVKDGQTPATARSPARSWCAAPFPSWHGAMDRIEKVFVIDGPDLRDAKCEVHWWCIVADDLQINLVASSASLRLRVMPGHKWQKSPEQKAHKWSKRHSATVPFHIIDTRESSDLDLCQ